MNDCSDEMTYMVMDWPVEDIAKIAIAAHMRDMKLNDFIVMALEHHLDKHSPLENGDD